MVNQLISGQVTSPFRFKPGRMKVENKHVSTSYKAINKLLMDGKIDDDDIQLLKLIYKFKYLNRRNLEILINCIGDKKGNEEGPLDDLNLGAGAIHLHNVLKDYKKRLSKLSEYGLVVRYYYLYSDEDGNRTPYIYTISKGALSYIKKRFRLFFNLSESLILDANEIIFSKLCINQFRIAAMTDPRVTIEPGSMIVDNNAYSPKEKKSFNIYCGFDISVADDTLIPVIVEPIRKFATWESYINKRTQMICDYFKTHRCFKNKMTPIIIFVCENDLHIEETYLSFVKKHTIIDSQYFFTSDVRVLIDGPFTNLVKCSLSHEDYVLLDRYELIS